MIKAQRGTIDILPSESGKWQKIEQTAREVCRLHNIREIRTPIFEATELFARSSGESSDVVNKEMYTFIDKGGRSLTLKPEGTAGVVRAFIEHGLFSDTLPIKLYYITPVFRYEKPQAGRLREFRQFGVELFGSSSPKIVAEALETGRDFLQRLGIKNVKAKINTLGCASCRENYVKLLTNYFSENIDNMCADCKRRIKQNPLRILDCKMENCKKIAQNAPRISTILCEDCKREFEQLKVILNDKQLDYQVDELIIRGLDYYTGVVFELVTEDVEGSSGIVGAGGQYNNLVEELGGQSTAAVGFAFGMERLLLLMEKQQVVFQDQNQLDCFVVCMSSEYASLEQNVLKLLRDNNLSADCDYMDRSFRASMKYADKLQAKYVCIIGEEEYKQNSVMLKDMNLGEQKLVKIDDLLNIVK